MPRAKKTKKDPVDEEEHDEVHEVHEEEVEEVEEVEESWDTGAKKERKKEFKPSVVNFDRSEVDEVNKQVVHEASNMALMKVLVTRGEDKENPNAELARMMKNVMRAMAGEFRPHGQHREKFDNHNRRGKKDENAYTNDGDKKRIPRGGGKTLPVIA